MMESVNNIDSIGILLSNYLYPGEIEYWWQCRPLFYLSTIFRYRIKSYKEYENGFRRENEKSRVLQKYVMYYAPVDVLYLYERFNKLVPVPVLSEFWRFVASCLIPYNMCDVVTVISVQYLIYDNLLKSFNNKRLK